MKSPKQSRKKDTRKRKKMNVKKTKPIKSFQKINPYVAGIDLGSAFHFVAAPEDNETITVRKFGSFTSELYSMAEWLKECKIESVAMEATGVYWMTVYEILEDHGFEVILVNSRNIKNVSGRKTDVEDAEWIQQLHSYGLLHGAFVPERQTAKLRALVRQRSQLVETSGQYIQRMQKALIQMNVRLDNVISDITGVTGMRIIKAIIAGDRDPKHLASFRDGRCKNSIEVIEESLKGHYRDEYIFILKQNLGFFEFTRSKILECEQMIHEVLQEFEARTKQNDNELEPVAASKPSRKKHEYYFDLKSELIRITGIDLTKLAGVQTTSALTIISEIGLNMNRWPTEKHFASWLSLCPNNKMSGGKVLRSRSNRSSNKAAITLRMCVSSLYSESNETALGAFFRRKKSHIGAPKATTAAANKLSKFIYNALKTGEEFVEIGADKYMEQYKEKAIRRMKRTLNSWGYKIEQKIPA